MAKKKRKRRHPNIIVRKPGKGRKQREAGGEEHRYTTEQAEFLAMIDRKKHEEHCPRPDWPTVLRWALEAGYTKTELPVDLPEWKGRKRGRPRNG